MIFYVILFVVVCFLLTRVNRKKFEKYDFKCFLLGMKNEPSRSEQFVRSIDKKMPLEIIYGKDTRTPQKAQQFQEYIDPDYYDKAVEMYHDPEVRRPDITYFNLGAIGCFMGHMEFYEKCFKQDLKYAVIFEDNVIIDSNRIYDEIQSVIDEKGDDFEMCFFHCLSRLPEKKEGTLEKVKWISSTKCYLINVHNMRWFKRFFLPMDNHVDMKHEDLIVKGARIYYKDFRKYMHVDRKHTSTIGHSEHGRPSYFSRTNPDATPDDLKSGF
jgi:GR25 family glycosyltransferase involved in LPS biosynthesis